MSTSAQAKAHVPVTRAVHDEGGADRDADPAHGPLRLPARLAVAPSRVRSPISPFTPRALTGNGVERQIKAFVRCAELARDAGYDGVEIMGSEGYFINQFLVTHTNKRTDRWGGSYENRMRLPVEIVRRTREAVGPDFILIYRLSMLDLVPDGSTWAEVGRSSPGRSRPRAPRSSTPASAGTRPACPRSPPRSRARRSPGSPEERLMGRGLAIPLVTTNRINTPEVAEQVLAEGCADMVSHGPPASSPIRSSCARPRPGRADEINTCIACNQACLDHTFSASRASCLRQPARLPRDRTRLQAAPAPKRVAVVGAGPGGPRRGDHRWPSAATR